MNLPTLPVKSPATKKKLSLRIKENYQVYLMIAVPLILLLAFVVYPLLWNIRFSVYEYDGFTKSFNGLYNFKRVLTDPMWWKAVANTFIFTIFKTVIMFPIAIVLAVILNGDLRGRNFIRAAYFTPYIISMAIASMIFIIMFSGYNGIVNEILKSLGIIRENVEWLGSESTAMGVVVAVNIWKDLGYNILLVLAGLQSIPRELYESAAIDGANSFKKLWYVTLPQLGPVLQLIIMLSFVGSLHAFDSVNVLTAGGPNHATDVMMTYLFNYYFGTESTSPQQGYAAAVSVVASIIIAIFTLIYLKASKKMQDAE